MPNFDLNDPSTYSEQVPRATRLQRNYSYQVEIQYLTRRGLKATQHITVSSNSVLGEDSIFSIAQQYATGSGRSSINGEIQYMVITDAIRSRSLNGETL